MKVEFHHLVGGIGVVCIIGSIGFVYAAFPSVPLLDEAKLVALHSELMLDSFVFLYGVALVLGSFMVKLQARLGLLEKQISQNGGESCGG